MFPIGGQGWSKHGVTYQSSLAKAQRKGIGPTTSSELIASAPLEGLAAPVVTAGSSVVTEARSGLNVKAPVSVRLRVLCVVAELAAESERIAPADLGRVPEPRYCQNFRSVMATARPSFLVLAVSEAVGGQPGCGPVRVQRCRPPELR